MTSRASTVIILVAPRREEHRDPPIRRFHIARMGFAARAEVVETCQATLSSDPE